MCGQAQSRRTPHLPAQQEIVPSGLHGGVYIPAFLHLEVGVDVASASHHCVEYFFWSHLRPCAKIVQIAVLAA